MSLWFAFYGAVVSIDGKQHDVMAVAKEYLDGKFNPGDLLKDYNGIHGAYDAVTLHPKQDHKDELDRGWFAVGL